MSARVTSSEVIAIMDGIPSSVTDLSAFISVANVIVDNRLGGATELTEDELKNIELYLSAHFAGLKYRLGVMEKLGDATSDYKNEIKVGFYQTTYGQQAIALDSTGTLAEDSTGKLKAKFGVLEADRTWTNY